MAVVSFHPWPVLSCYEFGAEFGPKLSQPYSPRPELPYISVLAAVSVYCRQRGDFHDVGSPLAVAKVSSRRIARFSSLVKPRARRLPRIPHRMVALKSPITMDFLNGLLLNNRSNGVATLLE